MLMIHNDDMRGNVHVEPEQGVQQLDEDTSIFLNLCGGRPVTHDYASKCEKSGEDAENFSGIRGIKLCRKISTSMIVYERNGDGLSRLRS
jgi:hypothetical protein